MSPTSPKLSGFKAPETRLSHLSSREEGVWLEERDHSKQKIVLFVIEERPSIQRKLAYFLSSQFETASTLTRSSPDKPEFKLSKDILT